MKVNLIFPHVITTYQRLVADMSLPIKTVRQVLGLGETNYTPPMSLMMLAAVTPLDVEIQIIDEQLDQIDYSQQVDLVGISVHATMAAPHAYEIADQYRQRGVAVVLGGIHPSALPREAIQHANAVVIGEGEEAWPRVLADFKIGQLKSFYRGQRQLDLDKLPLPRRNLIREPKRYLTTALVATSRGCENHCSFCSAQIAIGKKRRARSIENVMSEVSKLEGKVVVFLDDNLGWDTTYAKQLFRALMPLKIKWYASTSLLSFEDTEFLELAAKSGGTVFQIGFESMTPLTIAGVRKQQTNDTARYLPLVKQIHDHGMSIKGGFVLGFDTDTLDIFKSLVEFVNEACIDAPNINTFVPYPGTSIFRQFDKEGRLLHKNWAEYETGGSVVYQPRQMSREQMMSAYAHAVKEIFSINSSIHRIVGANSLSSIVRSFGALYWDLDQRVIAKAYGAGLVNGREHEH